MHHKGVHNDNTVIILAKRLQNIAQISVDLVKLIFKIASADDAAILADCQLTGDMVSIQSGRY